MEEIDRIIENVNQLSKAINEFGYSTEQLTTSFEKLVNQLPRILQAENGLWYIYYDKNIQAGNIDDDSVDGPYNSFEECLYLMDDNPDLELPMIGKM